jgi:hypothetical protein
MNNMRNHSRGQEELLQHSSVVQDLMCLRQITTQVHKHTPPLHRHLDKKHGAQTLVLSEPLRKSLHLSTPPNNLTLQVQDSINHQVSCRRSSKPNESEAKKLKSDQLKCLHSSHQRQRGQWTTASKATSNITGQQLDNMKHRVDLASIISKEELQITSCFLSLIRVQLHLHQQSLDLPPLLPLTNMQTLDQVRTQQAQILIWLKIRRIVLLW